MCDKTTFVRGAVVMMLADTLAAHAIGGFKVGVGFSLRKCRMCLATKESMSEKVNPTPQDLCGVCMLCALGQNLT